MFCDTYRITAIKIFFKRINLLEARKSDFIQHIKLVPATAVAAI